MELLSRDGGKVPIEVNASKTEYQGREADLAIVRDVTERKRAEQTLRASEAKFRNLVRSCRRYCY